VTNGPFNHDESVRLQQDNEQDEIEQKSNRDKQSTRKTRRQTKEAAKKEEVKVTPSENTKLEENHQVNPPSTNAVAPTKNSDPRNYNSHNNEMSHGQSHASNTYQNWGTSPMKAQPHADPEPQPKVQKQPMQTPEKPPVVEQRQQLPTNMLQNLMQSSQLKFQTQPQSLPQMPAGVASGMKYMQPAQAYVRNVQSPPPVTVMNQPRQTLPGLSNINFAVDNRKMQHGLPNQYVYPIRNPQSYIPQNQFQYGGNRMQGQTVQLPGLNQFVGSLNMQQFAGQQPTHAQIPANFYNQMAVKNLLAANQQRMQSPPPGQEYNMGAMGRSNMDMNRGWPQNNPYGRRPN
jgi:hypothetical protein